MTSFLEKTALHLLQTYGEDLSGVGVVMPNRRAGLFLRKHLAARLTKPSWAPAVFSIEDFMASLSGLTEVEPVHLLIDLYDIHKQKEKTKAQPFDEFLSWGGQLLADFNEIDRYMADAEGLFGYLNEVRAINLWNLDKSPLTEFQQNYLRFYNSLYGYYTKLNQVLLPRGVAYQGLVFRQAVERLEKGLAAPDREQVVFAGFNALTTAEERVMDHLRHAGKAEFLWDADRYYLDQPHQEAGTFLRQWLNNWHLKEKRWISEEFRTGRKNIEVIGIPGVAGQVKYCGELLSGLEGELDERTAIVLPDEKLLLPLLNSLPAGIREVNVTMGFPLKQTPLADLLDLVFRMHLNAPGMKTGKRSDRFYFRDVLRVLQHPLVARIAVPEMQGNLFVLHELCATLRTGAKIYLRREDLRGAGLFAEGLDFLDPFFDFWSQPGDAIRDLRLITGLLRDVSAGEQGGGSPGLNQPANPAEPEYAFAFTKILHQLDDILRSFPGYFSWPTFYQFFRQLTEGASLPFYGEPLKGVQVMGMLETRTLDFDRLILLSCNEGLLPSGKTSHSFIPFDIKRDFGLPTFHQKDAVYAYHFYRLLQRAGKIWLLYNTESDQLGGSERSRYIQQIIRELPAYNPSIIIREHLLSSPLPKGVIYPPIVVPKEGKVLERMLKKANDGIAPTALNAYRSCPLRFYFSDIAGLREPDEAGDTIDPKSLGTAVHGALQQLFGPLKGQVIRDSDVESMLKSADEAVEQAFSRKFTGAAVSSGKNLLLVNVARLLVRNFLKSELALVEDLAEKGHTLTIGLLEQFLRKTIQVTAGEEEIGVAIKGAVDRTDRIGGVLRVIDYKTGQADRRELSVDDWQDLLDDPALDKAFQLLTYAWLIADNPGGQPVRAGIISLRRPGSGLLTVQVPGEGRGTDNLGIPEIGHFGSILAELVSAIFDTARPFVQTSNTDTCARCPYAAICGR